MSRELVSLDQWLNTGRELILLRCIQSSQRALFLKPEDHFTKATTDERYLLILNEAYKYFQERYEITS